MSKQFYWIPKKNIYIYISVKMLRLCFKSNYLPLLGPLVPVGNVMVVLRLNFVVDYIFGSYVKFCWTLHVFRWKRLLLSSGYKTSLIWAIVVGNKFVFTTIRTSFDIGWKHTKYIVELLARQVKHAKHKYTQWNTMRACCSVSVPLPFHSQPLPRKSKRKRIYVSKDSGS
jgi:hypothetical protein